MKPLCTICGRRTTPFVFLGREPIGPSCARNMGLTKAKAAKNPRVRFVDYKPERASKEQNLDLFEDVKP